MTDVIIDRRTRPAISSGSYALMFTDIEGSTALLQHLGDDYGAVLVRHQYIVRAATAQFRGREVDTQGDSFFLLFKSAADALAAAIAVQRGLAAEPWPEGVQVRVRIGLHVGVVKTIEGECVGLDVHLAARICECGNGGQTVLSRSVARNLADAEIRRLGIALRPLGSHRLKNIRYPEVLFDMQDPQLPGDFPPLRSLGSRRTNITTPRGPIVGRDREVGELIDLIANQPGRIVTILGAGGTGKSTVAERIAALAMDDYADGTHFVDLGGVTEKDLVFPTIAQTLGIRDFPGRAVEADIAAAIGDSRQLMVIDTFEHVLGAAAGLAQIATECPNLRILVTSRAELGLASERTYLLSPLELPADGDPEPEASGAMRLFVERSREADPGFTVDESNRTTICEIVRKLEGVPLALELAAARLVLLTPVQLLERLTARFQLLRSSRRDLDRHKTLRDAIEWSFNLLDEDEREIFLRVSVFVGGFKLEDAESVFLAIPGIEIDVLEAVASLASKSLIHRRVENGEPRFDMYDMIREYAAEALHRRGAKVETDGAFLAHYTSVAEECGAMVMHREQRSHVIRLVEEADNLRSALRSALDGEDIAATARLVKAMFWYWITQGLFTEGVQWIDRACALADRRPGDPAAGVIHFAAAYVMACSGDYAGALPHGESACRVFKENAMDDRAREAALIHALCAAGSGAMDDPSEIIMSCIEHLRSCGDHYSTALGYIILGEGARFEGQTQAAEGCYREALGLLDRIGNTFWPGLLKQNIAHFRITEGDADAAAALLADASDLGEEYDYPIVTNLCVAGLGGVALVRGDARTAARLLCGVEHNMAKIGASFEPADKADIDRYVAGAREALGEVEFERCGAAGAALSWEALRREARAIVAGPPTARSA